MDIALRAPATPRTLVARARLVAQLERGADARLTLVCAPAGFGKSTLLAAWLAQTARRCAWVCLDDRDNDPARFWAHVLAAIGGATDEGGSLAAVLGALAADGGPRALVLDDYHVIDSLQVQDEVALLIADAPQHVQIAIATRADPRLPLARMRAGGELVEVRASQLRFSADEAREYLTGAMALPLSVQEVALLGERTEGWIAALQLAALSLTGRDDAAAFIADFAGDDRFVVDYLVEEVLQRQPSPVRGFLLETSVLRRLTAPLCDAVTGRGDGAAMLDALERTNLFLIPLDDRRRWYRYHHLFGDMLRARLAAERPGAVAALHERARDWCEQHGDLPEAIHHALAAGDGAGAARLVELAIPAARRAREEAAMHGWLEALPEAEIRARPHLAVGRVGVLLQRGVFDGVEELLDAAEAGLAGAMDSDNPEVRHLPGMAAAYRAALAQSRGDLAGTASHAARAFVLADPTDHLARGASAGLAGLASWAMGDLEAAASSWADSIASLSRAGHVADAMGGTIALADILRAQGRLGHARKQLEARLAEAAAAGVVRGTADMHVALAVLDCDLGDAAAARERLDAATALRPDAGLPQNAYRAHAALARVAALEGDLASAHRHLTDAQAAYVGDFFPDVQPLAARKARVNIASGDASAALEWASGAGFAIGDPVSYLHEYAHVTLAGALAATADEDGIRQALPFIDRLAGAAAARRGVTAQAELLVIEARARLGLRDRERALEALRAAVGLAQPERLVAPFAWAGPGVGALLRELERDRATAAFVRSLRPGAPIPASGARGLVEPLSERELDVLRLLRSDLSGPDVARELFVSLNTLRTHTKAIFAKLGVTNRRAAVTAAERLGLFDRT